MVLVRPRSVHLSVCKGNIFKFGFEWTGVRTSNTVRFSTENWPYLGNGETWQRLLLISNRKWHIGFQMRWKSLTLDDLEAQYAPLWLSGAR